MGGGGGNRYKLPGTAVRQAGRVPTMLHFLFQAQVTLQLTVSLSVGPLLLGAVGMGEGAKKCFTGPRTRSRRPNEELTAHVHIRLHGVFLD